MQKLKVYPVSDVSMFAMTVTKTETFALISLLKAFQEKLPRYKESVAGLLEKTRKAPKENEIAYFFYLTRDEVNEFLRIIKLLKKEEELKDLKSVFDRALAGELDDPKNIT